MWGDESDPKMNDDHSRRACLGRGWFCAFAGALCLLSGGGCRPAPPTTATASSPPPPRLKDTGPAPRLPLFDGFEAETIAGFWLPGDYGTGLHVPGAIRLSSRYARSGARSAEITVHAGDIEQRGDDNKRVERAELDSGHYSLIDRDIWYGFSLLIPPGFPIVDDRLVLASWKQSDVEGSPLIGLRFRNNRHSVSIRPPGASGGGTTTDLPDLVRGHWYDFVVHIRYATGADGKIEVWLNRAPVLAYTGPTASPAGANRFYNKVGLYRDRWPAPMTLYVDNYAVGTRRTDVDPSRFGIPTKPVPNKASLAVPINSR